MTVFMGGSTVYACMGEEPMLQLRRLPNYVGGLVPIAPGSSSMSTSALKWSGKGRVGTGRRLKGAG